MAVKKKGLGRGLTALLENSDVVQIIPPIGSAYIGQENIAEVLPEKVSTADPSLSGCVASVERHGYKYEFNGEQERIIQPAQVNLYE